MNVEAWDDDPVTDDFIGETSVNLSKYLGMNGQPVSEYVSMEKRGKHIGRVMMSIQFNQIGMVCSFLFRTSLTSSRITVESPIPYRETLNSSTATTCPILATQRLT
jgi:hypothetical protein